MADIEITGSARGAVAAVETARRSLQQLASTAPSAAESARWKASADNINAWKRAASGVAPQLTGLIDSMEEFAEGAEKIGGSAMASRVALLALGTAATAAAAAVVAAGTAIVASSIEVIAHLEDYNDVATRHREVLEDAADAYGGLGTAMRELRVEIAGQMAPQLASMFDTLAGGIIIVNRAVTAFDGLSGAIGAGARGLLGMIPGMTMVIGLLDVLNAIGKDARADTSGPMFNMEQEASAAAAAQAVADSFILAQEGIARATSQATTAAKAHTPELRAEAAAVEALEIATWNASDAIAEMARQEATWRANARRAAEVAGPKGQNRATPAAPVDPAKAANQMVSQAGAVQGAWTASLTNIVGMASSVFGTIASLSAASTNQQIGDISRMSSAQRRELRERFRREKATAIALAIVQGALSVVQTLASTPYPANIVLGALQAAAVGVEVATMSRQQPTYHRGGMWAPDERMGPGGSRILASERMAVYSARSAPTEADVARVSTGERSSPEGGGIMPTITLMLDGVRTAWRQHAGPSAGYSPGRMAYGV